MGDRRQFILAALFASSIFALAGCGGDGLLQCIGEVTLDDQPLGYGTIDFRPADGRGPTASALIKNGEYEVRVAPGAKVVIIQAFHTTGEERANPHDPESPLVPICEPIPLAEYTEDSQTTVDIQSAYDVDFQLRSSP